MRAPVSICPVKILSPQNRARERAIFLNEVPFFVSAFAAQMSNMFYAKYHLFTFKCQQNHFRPLAPGKIQHCS
jgi:hypothetical protein